MALPGRATPPWAFLIPRGLSHKCLEHRFTLARTVTSWTLRGSSKLSLPLAGTKKAKKGSPCRWASRRHFWKGSYLRLYFPIAPEMCEALAQSARYSLRQRSEEHTSELQSRLHLVCRLLLEKKKKKTHRTCMCKQTV